MSPFAASEVTPPGSPQAQGWNSPDIHWSEAYITQKEVEASTNVGDILIFEVENTLFKAPKTRFFEGERENINPIFFPQILESLNHEDPFEINPIKIEGIKKVDFKRFLMILYPGENKRRDKEEWLSILRLSTMWNFENIRKIAKNSLTTILQDEDAMAVERVQLAREFGLVDILLDAYYDLARRETKLSDDEAETVGFETAFSLMQIRDDAKDSLILLIKRKKGRTSLGISSSEFDFNYRFVIETKFEKELKAMKSRDSYIQTGEVPSTPREANTNSHSLASSSFLEPSL